MKRIVLLSVMFVALMLLAFTCNTFAQTKVVANGNTLTAIKSNNPNGGDSSSLKTKYVFVDSKGISYPVYLSVRGKYYYNRVAKTSGNIYKVYIDMTGVASK
jgi:hypothetical protein